MRQLAGTKMKYRRAHAAPLAGLISGRAKYNSFYGEAEAYENYQKTDAFGLALNAIPFKK